MHRFIVRIDDPQNFHAPVRVLENAVTQRLAAVVRGQDFDHQRGPSVRDALVRLGEQLAAEEIADGWKPNRVGTAAHNQSQLEARVAFPMLIQIARQCLR